MYNHQVGCSSGKCN